MGKTLICFSDDQTVIEKARSFAALHGIELKVLPSAAYQQQTSANVLPFPGTQRMEPLQSVGTRKMSEVESEAIRQALVAFNGNYTEAAKALGMGRATLYRKLKSYQINGDESRAAKKKAA
jgi:transcriptional regulator of acetoin/glycerol metabolism